MQIQLKATNVSNPDLPYGQFIIIWSYFRIQNHEIKLSRVIIIPMILNEMIRIHILLIEVLKFQDYYFYWNIPKKA